MATYGGAEKLIITSKCSKLYAKNIAMRGGVGLLDGTITVNIQCLWCRKITEI